MKTVAFIAALLAASGAYALNPSTATLLSPAIAQDAAKEKEADYKRVESEIREVLVFPTQARVTRQGTFKIPAGESRFAFYKLPKALNPNVLTAEVLKGSGVRIVSVQHTVDYTKDEKTEAFAAATKAYKDAKHALDAIDVRIAQTNDGISAALALRPKRPDGAGTSPLPMDFSLEINNILMKTVVEEVTRLQTEQRELKTKRIDAFYAYRKAREVYDKTRSVVNEDNLAVVTFSAEKETEVSITLSYMIYGAQWSPAYDVRVSPDDGNVTLSSYAILRQQTGEDWTGVPIIFSTADPNISADLPELRGQLITERFVPSTSLLAKMAPLRSSISYEAAEEADAFVYDDKSIVSYSMYSTSREPVRPPSKSSTAAASVVSSSRKSRAVSAEADVAVRATQSMALSSQMINNVSTLFTNDLVLSDGSTIKDCKVIEIFRTDVAIRTASGELKEIPMDKISKISSRMVEGRGLDISPSRLISPIRSAGGFDYRYPTARMENVPSDNQYRRILLKTAPLSGDCYYSLVPSLSEHAYLMCRTTNTLGAPILPGPANLFYGSDYTGDIDLPRLDENAKHDLGLGVDQRLKFERKIYKHSETIGVISKARQTKITGEIKVTNNLPEKVKIQLDESLPVSNTDRVVIHEIKYSQKPNEDASVKDYKGTLPAGWRRWELGLDKGKSSTLTVDYTIEYPTDYVILHGINDPNPSIPGFGPAIDNATTR